MQSCFHASVMKGPNAPRVHTKEHVKTCSHETANVRVHQQPDTRTDERSGDRVDKLCVVVCCCVLDLHHLMPPPAETVLANQSIFGHPYLTNFGQSTFGHRVLGPAKFGHNLCGPEGWGPRKVGPNPEKVGSPKGKGPEK